MRLVKLIIWIVVLVAGILFALYNKQTLQLNFLMLHSKVLPVWSFLIIAFVIGLMISFLYGLIDIMRLKTKIKGQANEIDELKKEMEEPEPYLLFTITDEQGKTVRKIKTKAKKGVNRIVWDFRYDKFTPVSLKQPDNSVPWNEPDLGYMVVPGKYNVSLSKFENGKLTELVSPQPFVCKLLYDQNISEKDRVQLDKFNKKVAKLTVAVTGADAYRKNLVKKLNYFKKAVDRKSTRLNSSHIPLSRMPSSA